MLFTALSWATAVAALLALWRARPALFLLAANQITVLRALDHAAQFGQPRSQSFLPPFVYSQGNLAIAQWLFLASTVILLAFIVLPARRAPLVVLPPLPRWMLRGVVLFLVLLAASQRTIFTHAYTDPDRTIFGLNLGGANALLYSLGLYELVRRRLAGELSGRTAFFILAGTLLLTDFLKGSTGFATGYLVVGALLLLGGLPGERLGLKALGSVGLAILFAVALAAAVRGMRADLHNGSVSDELAGTFSRLLAQEEQTSADAEGVELHGNGVQYAAHVLECITLQESGQSRDWKSIYLPLQYTFQPSFLAEPLGLTREREAAWELGDYFIHGGGVYLLGELYWNGGWACVLVVFFALVAFAFWCDTRVGSSVAATLLAVQFTPGLLQGIGYGFAQTVRGAINGLLVLAVVFVAQRQASSAKMRARISPAS